MKICEAFRKAWETDCMDYRWARRIKDGANARRGFKGQPKEEQRLHFNAWIEGFHGYLSKSEVEKYGITREQIEEAHEAGFVREWERFNTGTRFRGEHAYGLQLTKKGKTALFQAYENWIPQ